MSTATYVDIPFPDGSRRRRGRVVLSLLAVLAVAAAGAGAYETLHWHDLKQQADDRKAAKEAASGAITKFTAFDYRHLDADLAAAKAVMTPCFGAQYVKTLQAAVPQATMAKAVVTDQVDGAQVVDKVGDVIHVQVFFDQKAEFGDGRPTEVTPYRVVVDMKKIGGTWLVNFLELPDSTSKRVC